MTFFVPKNRGSLIPTSEWGRCTTPSRLPSKRSRPWMRRLDSPERPSTLWARRSTRNHRVPWGLRTWWRTQTLTTPILLTAYISAGKRRKTEKVSRLFTSPTRYPKFAIEDLLGSSFLLELLLERLLKTYLIFAICYYLLKTYFGSVCLRN